MAEDLRHFQKRQLQFQHCKRQLKHLLKILTPFVFLLTLKGEAVDHFRFYRLFNRIDNDLINGDTIAALKRCDSAMQIYQYPDAMHCIKAFKICSYAQDSSRGSDWMKACIKAGLPAWLFNTDSQFIRQSKTFWYRKNLSQFETLAIDGKSHINMRLRHTIDSLFRIDQKLTRRVNDGFIPLRYTVYYLHWRRNNRKQTDLLDSICMQSGFPGERLIGLHPEISDSLLYAPMYRKFGSIIFQEKSALFMYIHYFSNRRSKSTELLKRNLYDGTLPPLFFANICDFAAKYGHDNTRLYYNSWHSDHDTSHNQQINTRRLLIGLNTLTEMKRNSDLYLKLFKNRLACSAILPE